MSQQQPSLEERVAYLEENIHALNKATTDTAIAVKALLAAIQTQSSAVTANMNLVLENVCPFPPNCDEPQA